MDVEDLIDMMQRSKNRCIGGRNCESQVLKTSLIDFLDKEVILGREGLTGGLCVFAAGFLHVLDDRVDQLVALVN